MSKIRTLYNWKEKIDTIRTVRWKQLYKRTDDK